MTGHVTVRARGDRSDVIRGRNAGPLRLLFPRAAGRAAWIVTSSFGGGLVNGDDVALDVVVEAAATAVVTTQASTKAYRGTTCQRTHVHVADGALAIVVPDAVVPYRDATFAQHTRVDLAPGGSLVLVDVLTAGRVAHGERWEAARIDSRLEILRAGAPVLVDRVVLDRRDGAIAPRMRRFEALGTALLVGPRVAAHAAAAIARAAGTHDPTLAIAANVLADGAIARIAAEHVTRATASVRSFVGEACLAAGEAPWARKW